METRTKADLARRLGMDENELISREEVAEILGLSVGTLRTKADQHVGYFRLSDARTAPALYPKPWVLKYKQWRESGAKTRFPDEMYGPEREWPPEPEQRPIGTAAAILMIDRWKFRELHRRCEAICEGNQPRSVLWVAHEAETRLLFDSEGRRRPIDDPELHAALVEKAKEVIQPKGVYRHPEQLVSLMKVVWEYVLETERQWLARLPI